MNSAQALYLNYLELKKHQPYHINLIDELHANENAHTRILVKLLQYQKNGSSFVLDSFLRLIEQMMNSEEEKKKLDDDVCIEIINNRIIATTEIVENKNIIENEFYILVQKYVKSELTHTILTHICNGDYKNNLPEELVVDSNIIRSTLNGRPYSFDFTQRRITPLHNNGSHWQVSANEAMAEAINKLMGGNYSIYEKDGTAHMELKAMYDF